jgi:hypothetical protein
MNKAFIGLLIIIAAGAGVFFFLRKQNKTSLNKEWIAGSWKLDSLAHKDSSSHGILLLPDVALKSYQYNFNTDSSKLVIVGDSGSTVSLYYQWRNGNKLMVMDNATDTTGDVVTVNQLTNDKMVVQSVDSTLLFFIKTNYLD